MAFLNISYVVDASWLKYPVKEFTIRPTTWLTECRGIDTQKQIIPKMMFITGMVTPAPIDVNTAARSSILSSHVEKENIRWDVVSHVKQNGARDGRLNLQENPSTRSCTVV